MGVQTFLMTPWQKAKKWLMEWKAEASFEEQLAHFMSYGYVINTPEMFMMFKEVEVRKGSVYEGNVKPNAWFIQLAAKTDGKPLEVFMEIEPSLGKDHEYLVWQRRGQEEYRIWKKHEVRKRLLGGN